MRGRSLRGSVGDVVLKRVGRAASRVQEETPLAVDVLESDDEYLVVFDAPGANASDVQVSYADGDVRVRVDRFREFHEGFDMRFPGRGLSLDGRAELPEDAVVDAARARATLRDDGTLHVVLPKESDGGTDQSADDESDGSVDETDDTESEE